MYYTRIIYFRVIIQWQSNYYHVKEVYLRAQSKVKRARSTGGNNMKYYLWFFSNTYIYANLVYLVGLCG